jgi:hypothetical protein
LTKSVLSFFGPFVSCWFRSFWALSSFSKWCGINQKQIKHNSKQIKFLFSLHQKQIGIHKTYRNSHNTLIVNKKRNLQGFYFLYTKYALQKYYCSNNSLYLGLKSTKLKMNEWRTLLWTLIYLPQYLSISNSCALWMANKDQIS